MCHSVVSVKVEIRYYRSGEAAEVNVRNQEYEVEHNMRNRSEIPRGGGEIKNKNTKIQQKSYSVLTTISDIQISVGPDKR